MKATGIVRRIDDLGRVVIPKEIRRTLRIREGDPLEIYVDREGEVILKKYSPVGELKDFAKEYTEALSQATGYIAYITDRDTVIAVAGAPKKEFIDKPVSTAIERIMASHKASFVQSPRNEALCEGCPSKDLDGGCKITAEVVAPIALEGESIGAVVLASKNPETKMGAAELLLVETASVFLAKQMEQ